MNWLRKSLFLKIAFIFLGLIAGMGAVQMVSTLRSALRLIDETDQKLNLGLASDLAQSFQPYLADSLNYGAIESAFKNLMIMNPRVELYLLDTQGNLLAYFADPIKIKRMSVSIDPIRRLGAGEKLPILGDDPRSVWKSKPISAADISIGDQSGYLYIILGGEDYESIISILAQSTIVRTGLQIGLVILLMTGLVGIGLFFLVTRRLQGLTRAVQQFKEGRFDVRTHDDSADEIGELARAFNDMSDSIESNLEQMAATDRLRRELVANVSHDLRSPLASIQGYVETLLLKEDSLPQEERRQLLEVVYQNIQGLGKQVEELFELSLLDARQREPNWEPFPVAELVQDVVLKFEPLAADKSLRLVNEAPPGLPLCMGDIGMIERVISNIIDNSIKYTAEGGTLSITVQPVDGGNEVVITDTGSGISAEDLPHIFERFYRADKSREWSSGNTGLGLAIAQRIMQVHHSSISAQSEVGIGTILQVYPPHPQTAGLDPHAHSRGRGAAPRRTTNCKQTTTVP